MYKKMIAFSNHNDTVGFTENEFKAFLCGFYRDAKIGRKKITEFKDWMRGQTVALINNESFYYDHDILRWLNGQPVID